MTNAKAQARQRAVDYMSRLLQMNPVHEGDEIISARSAALRLTKKERTASTQEAGQLRDVRRKLLDHLEAIRGEFWTMPLTTLQTRLSELDAHNYADLEAAITRLRVVAAHRSEFPILAEKPGFDGTLFSSLKQVLTQSPRDVTVLKEQILSSFRNRGQRKRGRRMVQLLRTQLPDVYRLEASWFDTLYRQKARLPEFVISGKSRSTPATSVGSGSDLHKYRWLIWILIVVVGRFIAALSGNSGTANRPPALPNNQFNNSPRFAPSDHAGETTKRKKSQGDPFLEIDKEVWQPYSRPHPPQPPGSFARPKTIDIDGPWKKLDDRFPR